MARYPLTQLVRQFPMLSSPFFRNRSLLDELEEGLLEETKTSTGLTIFEQGNQLIVEAEMPGLNPEEIEVTLNKGVLTIRGEHLEQTGEAPSGKPVKESKESKETSDRRYFQRSQRSWFFSLNLPVPVDETREPQATFKDGIMRVTFNKAQKDTLRKINVKKG